MATTLARFQPRRKTAAAWTTSNEVLLQGEFGYETDTGKQKQGDGSQGWTSLAYLPLMADLAALGFPAPSGGIGATTVLPGSGDLLAVAAAMTAGQTLSLTAGATYTLSAAARLTANNITVEGNGATVRLAAGAQTDTDRVFYLLGSNQTLRNVIVASRASGANSASPAWHIQIDGTANTVEKCRVTNVVPAGTGGQTSIGVSGGSDHVIRGNVVTGGGSIGYAWANSQRCRVENNRVVNSVANGIGGVGNASDNTFSYDNRITDNIIIGAARFGLEDFGGIARSYIAGNQFINCALMGMSLVGGQYHAENNTITGGSTQQGIEAASSGSRLTNNTIEHPANQPSAGIIVDGSGLSDTSAQYAGILIEGQTVINGTSGITVQNSNQDVTIRGGRFLDCGSRAISFEPASATVLKIDGATIVYTKPSSSPVRDGISAAGPSTAEVKNCRILYTATSAGTSSDYYVRISDNNAIVTGNTFDGSGRTDTNKPVVGNAYNSALAYCNVTNNTFRGGATLQAGKFAASSTLTGNFTQQ